MGEAMASSVYAERHARALERMAAEGVDCLFVPVSTNLFYFSGVKIKKTERLTALVLSCGMEPFLVCPAFERSRVGAMSAVSDLRLWGEAEDPYRLVAGSLSARPPRRVAVESTAWFSEYARLAEALPGAEFVSASPITEALRAQKSPQEVEAIRRAASIMERARAAAVARARAGMSQEELKGLHLAAVKAEGGAEPSCTLTFGPNSSLPHGGSAPLNLRPTDVIMMDGGVAVNGYRCDLTRTWAFGRPWARFEEAVKVVLEAQAAAIAAAGPGVPAQEVDRAARRVIEGAGYGRYFTHRVGHGTGLDGHEKPYLAEGNLEPLLPGMVATVEPGIYLPGEFGVRIEDDIVITPDGCECLSTRVGSWDELILGG
ncbi:MAG: Xaa-Pro peptidase family protein [Acetobacteraceae bacterium]|nr:Xaa-Pro peptidase family protein [Acetobacteraceae bacterium]